MRALVLICTFAAVAASVVLSLAGAVSAFADIVNIAWPFQLAAGLVALAMLQLVRTPRWPWPRRAALVCAAGLAIAGTPWAMLRPATGETPAGVEPFLVVTTFNAWASNTDPETAAAAPILTSADIIAFQEIGLNARDLPARLAASHPYRVRCRWSVELVSRLPFEASGCGDMLALPAAWARVSMDGSPVTVLSVHLARPFASNWYDAHREALSTLIGEFTDPLVVMGDFNTGEGGFMMAGLERDLAPLRRVTRGHRTWPSERMSPVPLLGIDHVFLGEGLCAASVKVGPHAGSDHRPVQVGVARCLAP
ncbi:endonuclease/exonuclease/phosphatase family protein [Maricaulaceae bacterium MS644]